MMVVATAPARRLASRFPVTNPPIGRYTPDPTRSTVGRLRTQAAHAAPLGELDGRVQRDREEQRDCDQGDPGLGEQYELDDGGEPEQGNCGGDDRTGVEEDDDARLGHLGHRHGPAAIAAADGCSTCGGLAGTPAAA
jgi:hypothetical protein